jgi:hypothetical protein
LLRRTVILACPTRILIASKLNHYLDCPLLERRNVRPVAVDARFCGRLIEQNQFPLNFALQGMALRAGHGLVTASEGELGALVVIEGRRRPSLNGVAIRAWGNPVLGGELSSMRVGVAGIAVLRRSLELDVMSAGKRLVAIGASDHAMRSDQVEFRLRMVEPFDVNPGTRVVAGLAPQGRSIGAAKSHAILEFALVRIGVARRAGAVLEMEWQDFVRAAAQPDLVAIRAGHGGVGSGKRKARVFVLRGRKRGPVEIFYGVAIFATILVRRGGKLIVMGVLMAIHTGGEFDLIQRVFARRRVALVAGHRRMFSFQRILGSGVFLHAE